MPILNLGEVIEERSAEKVFLGSKYTRVYKVYCNAKTFGPWFMQFAEGIPQLGDAYGPEDPYSVVTRIGVTPHESDAHHWLVRIEYGYLEASTSEQQPNPLLRRDRYHWGQIREREEVTVDETGRRVVNSAGVPFSNTVLERDVCHPVLSVVKYQPTFDVGLANAFTDKNAVNDGPWLVQGMQAERGQAKCVSITADDGYEGGVYYWLVTYEFYFKSKGWNTKKVLDVGHTEKIVDPEDPKKTIWRRITDEFGHEVPEDVPLDGNGRILARNRDGGFDYVELPNEPGVDGYVLHPYMDFSLLGSFNG